ncbi:MAG: carbohydrate-binding domain-containing protein [Ruminococcaceae bacterium]|nr:carbohydrate-binding domain-containing protein [Oscillospiraceae bacterium]
MKKALSVLLILMLVLGLLSGCGHKGDSSGNNTNTHNSNNSLISDSNDNEDNNSNNDEGNNSNSSTKAVEVDFSENGTDMFTDRDTKTDYDESAAVTIKLNGNTATASSNSVKISGSKVTITEEATYVISGCLSDGMLIVDAKDTAKLQLVLGGVNITSKTSAALYILEADKVFVTLADGTANTLTNGGSFTAIDDNNIDAALFSKQDLTLNGNGSLTVTSPVGHGIVSKDDLVITGGAYTVNSASHGLGANDSIRIANATLNIDAGKDAIHSENNDDNSKGFIYISSGTIKGEAEGDGIAASSYMQITNGTINLLVGGGSKNSTKEHSDSFGGFMGGGRPGMRQSYSQSSSSNDSGTSMKGLKAANSLLISGGNITIDSADDSVHSDVSVTVGGGTLTIASGDDAIHAEETLTITAGQIDISESYEGLEALHIDIKGGNIKLIASDDGLNAAGGTDGSGTTGGRDGMFGGGGPGGHGGMSGNSNGSIKISGGTLYIKASGDGIDANGTLEITGGHTTLVGPTQGDTAVLDYDKSATITGGTFIGSGSTMMAQSFSDSKQGVIAIKTGQQTAGTQITVKDANGVTLISHKPELNFAMVILSSPKLVKGEKYTLIIGSKSVDFEAS